jgi:transposase
VALQTTVVTDPDAIKLALKPYLGRLRRVDHEAGSWSPWLHPELLKLGLPVVYLETYHVRSALSAQRNKTDKADALGTPISCVLAGFAKRISRARLVTVCGCC